MKRLFYIMLIALPLCAKDVDITSISEKIDALKQSKSTSPVLNYTLYDPFATAKPLLAAKQKPPLIKKRIRPIIVQTILNHRALIDGKWLRVGSSIYGGTISAIEQQHIVVTRGGKTITVPLKTGKRIIKTKEQH